MARAMADWGDAVYRLALGQTRSKADAEDVYQDVFMRLYGDATEFTSSEHLKAWLLRVTINRCRDLAKSNWAHLAVPRPRAGERPVDARKRADGSACRASVRRTRPPHAPRPAKGGAP